MKKIIVGAIAAMAFATPISAFADDTQLIALYQQLIVLLQQQVLALQANALTISTDTVPAPTTSVFTINHPQGNEAIDFGDGHSTGSAGCPQNAAGFCDLSRPISHIYQYPGTYTVTLYRTINGEARVITTSKVIIK